MVSELEKQMADALRAIEEDMAYILEEFAPKEIPHHRFPRAEFSLVNVRAALAAYDQKAQEQNVTY